MNVSDLIERAELAVKTGGGGLDAEVTGGYASDLLSAVMANALEGNVWVTWHAHPNIVAVALLVKLSAIILVAGRQPEDETAEKAEQEGMPILVSSLPAFELVGRLHAMGVAGTT